MIPMDECEKGVIYRLHSRNLTLGVYDGNTGFIGIREKFGSRYLFTEYHYDSGPPFGTVTPLAEVDIVPKEIELVEGHSICRICEEPEPIHDPDRGNETGVYWRHASGRDDHGAWAVYATNRPLFDLLNRLQQIEVINDRIVALAAPGGQPPPPDGILFVRAEYDRLDVYIDGTRQIIGAIHSPDDCQSRPCVIHAPSDHSMRSFPTHFRFDRGLMERICPHGVGHPDPDDLNYKLADAELRATALESQTERESILGKAIAEGIHGCDGCCMTPMEWSELLEATDAP